MRTSISAFFLENGIVPKRQCSAHWPRRSAFLAARRTLANRKVLAPSSAEIRQTSATQPGGGWVGVTGKTAGGEGVRASRSPAGAEVGGRGGVALRTALSIGQG